MLQLHYIQRFTFIVFNFLIARAITVLLYFCTRDGFAMIKSARQVRALLHEVKLFSSNEFPIICKYP